MFFFQTSLTHFDYVFHLRARGTGTISYLEKKCLHLEHFAIKLNDTIYSRFHLGSLRKYASVICLNFMYKSTLNYDMNGKLRIMNKNDVQLTIIYCLKGNNNSQKTFKIRIVQYHLKAVRIQLFQLGPCAINLCFVVVGLHQGRVRKSRETYNPQHFRKITNFFLIPYYLLIHRPMPIMYFNRPYILHYLQSVLRKTHSTVTRLEAPYLKNRGL